MQNLINDRHEKILDSAINIYGVDSQLHMAIEEMAELTKEICKEFREGQNHKKLQEEIADALITILQVARIAGIEEVKKQIDIKMGRLANSIILLKKKRKCGTCEHEYIAKDVCGVCVDFDKYDQIIQY